MTPRSVHFRLGAAAIAVGLVAAACGDDPSEVSPTTVADATTATTAATTPATTEVDAPATTSAQEPVEVTETITLVAYDSFPAPDPDNPLYQALDEFTAESGIAVDVLISGDTGTMLSKAELTAGNPEGDVMWGIDNTFLSRAVDAGVFAPYLSTAAPIASAFTDLVPNGEATPVDFGDVCVNYDVAALAALDIDPPDFEQLAEDYGARLVVENPATSSPGLAFLMATIAEYGDDWTEYWEALRDGGVQVVDSWTSAYYESFTPYGGDRPFVVSYGSSPPFEVLYAEEPIDTPPTGVLADTCFRQVEFAGVLAGTEHEAAARRLVDFLVSARFQQEVPLNLFVWPANPEAELDPVFTEFATIPEAPLSLDPAEISANRADWIDEWTAIMTG